METIDWRAEQERIREKRRQAHKGKATAGQHRRIAEWMESVL